MNACQRELLKSAGPPCERDHQLKYDGGPQGEHRANLQQGRGRGRAPGPPASRTADGGLQAERQGR
eukprot:5492871-Pyramimonas_sp.AAC.1